MTAQLFSIQELAAITNEWCLDYGVTQTDGRKAEKITPRMIRFYCSRGLLDAPGSASGETKRGFNEKHACQLRLVRLLQTRSMLLDQIEAFLHGRTLEQLQRIEQLEWQRLCEAGAVKRVRGAREEWSITSVDEEFLLVSRRGRSISEEQRRQIAVTLGSEAAGS